MGREILYCADNSNRRGAINHRGLICRANKRDGGPSARTVHFFLLSYLGTAVIDLLVTTS